jgi:hypothetical protein
VRETILRTKKPTPDRLLKDTIALVVGAANMDLSPQPMQGPVARAAPRPACRKLYSPRAF